MNGPDLYDGVFRLILREQGPKMLVPWYLMASYAYEVMSQPILTDGCFDWLCRELDRNWKAASAHDDAHRIDRSSVRAGSGLNARYGAMSRAAAEHIVKAIYKEYLASYGSRREGTPAATTSRIKTADCPDRVSGVDRQQEMRGTSMDEVLERIAAALERLADATETLAGASGGGDSEAGAGKGGKAAAGKGKAAAGKGKAKGPTLDDVRNALREYSKLEGKDAAKVLLQEHGEVEAVSELDESNYQAVIDACVA